MPAVVRRQHAAQGDDQQRRQRRGRGLAGQPALARLAAEVIADHGGGHGHDDRLADAHAHARENDGVQIVEKRRCDADARIDDHRRHQDASAAEPVGEPARHR